MSVKYAASPTLVDCTFRGNVADQYAGGLFNDGGSSSLLVNCTFGSNSTVMYGGGIRNADSTLTLINCALAGNTADRGGGIYSYSATAYLSNCTLYGNIATSSYSTGGLWSLDTDSTLANCILWANTNGSGSTSEDTQLRSTGEGTTDVQYSCIQGWSGDFGGSGNHGNDPGFEDPDGADDVLGTQDDDIRLSAGSPCVDAGDNTAVPADTLDLDGDDDLDEPVPFDLNGCDRFIDEPGTPDTGNPGPPGPIVDMGCFEFLVDCNWNCVADDQDIVMGTSRDCNTNGLPDECDIAGETSDDCQPNLIPDECDIAGMTSDDCQANGVPDECDLAGGTSEDCNTNEVPDECEPDEDCNGNGVQDICDVAGGTSDDCNANEVPDECEPDADCNGNGVQDICDIAGGTSLDCQPNIVPDECDLAEGTSLDENANGIPDECDVRRPMPEDCGAPCETGRGPCESDEDCAFESVCVAMPAGSPPGGICYAPKHRYISIARHADQVADTARRVRLNGGELLGWVGEPWLNAGQWFADLVDTPVYEETWPAVLHLSACEIATGWVYEVQAILLGQDLGDESAFSAPLVLPTATRWGDVVASCPSDICRPPQGIVNLDDIMAGIIKFQGVNAAPLSWLDIDPSTGDASPNQVINLQDILECVHGFQGEGYPGDGPLGCQP
jgi:hypothetical protein